MSNSAKMQIFRSRDAPALMDTDIMELGPFTDIQTAAMERLTEAGAGEGDRVRVLVSIPGFTLAHVWFGRDYPLPLHSHNVDCLYYIIAGSLQLGTEALEAGDSFFIPADAPYTYRPGDAGVEILEFRHAGKFDFQNHAKSAVFYEKAERLVAANRDAWIAGRAALTR